MNLLTSSIIGVALAADAMAMSISVGCAHKNFTHKNGLILAGSFALFQMVMPLIGWFLGVNLKTVIEGCDHWVAFALLALVGGKMIWEAIKESEEKSFDPTRLKIVLMLAIATSIDALAVGIGLSLVATDLLIPILIIGVITFALSMLGISIGRVMGHLLERHVEWIGGLILIGIGVKILIDHTT